MLVAHGTLTAKRVSQSWQMLDRRLEGGKPPVTTVGRKMENVNSRNTMLADYIVTAELEGDRVMGKARRTTKNVL